MVRFTAWIRPYSHSEKEIQYPDLTYHDVCDIVRFCNVTGFIVRIESYWVVVDPL